MKRTSRTSSRIDNGTPKTIFPKVNNSDVFVDGKWYIYPSLTPTMTPTVTPSLTPSSSVQMTPSVTPSRTPSITPSLTPSMTLTPSVTPTVTPSMTLTPSVTPSITPSVTTSPPPPSITPSITPTISPSPYPLLNYVRYSQDLTNPIWTPVNSTVGSSITAPDATSTANSLTVVSSDANIGQRLYSRPTTDYLTFSVYVKFGNINRNQIGLYNNTTPGWITLTNINWTGSDVTSLTTAVGAATNYVFTNEGSGWWRVSGTTFAVVGASVDVGLSLYVRGAGTGTAGHFVYVWGFQVQQGSTLSAYAPTT